jgi:hypothetical protein
MSLAQRLRENVAEERDWGYTYSKASAQAVLDLLAAAKQLEGLLPLDFIEPALHRPVKSLGAAIKRMEEPTQS